MTTIDFEQAQAAHLALKEFFAAHPKGRLDPAAFVSVQLLCRDAERALPDPDIRSALRNIENYSRLLAAQDPSARGADFVRLRVQNALASFRSKLKAIEAERVAVAS